jgi:hypothetical protein
LRLATHPGRINERLIAAGRALAKIPEKEYDLMPEGLGDDFREFFGKLTAHGSIPNTVATLSEDEAVSLAEDFWGLWEELKSIPREIGKP